MVVRRLDRLFEKCLESLTIKISRAAVNCFNAGKRIWNSTPMNQPVALPFATALDLHINNQDYGPVYPGRNRI